MTIAIITDQHLDGRKNSKVFWDYFLKFYDDIFFPALDKYKIKTVLDLGDTFDNRKNIDLAAWYRIKKHYFQRLYDRGIQVKMIIGNHTAYYKNTNRVNTPELLLDRAYDNIEIITEIQDLVVEGRKITFIPWINQENEEHVFDHINRTNAKIAMGHLEINGYQAYPGHFFRGGNINQDLFSKFEYVLSGHFHHKSERGNVRYLGNPYEMYWNDYADDRGFHLFDPKTMKLGFIKNPYRMFRKIFYDDTNTNYNTMNLTEYKNTYIKLIVNKKKSNFAFEKFVERLYDIGVHDLKIIEDQSLDFENADQSIECEDTLSILNKYVEDTEDIECDKNGIKDIIKSIYVEACEVQ